MDYRLGKCSQCGAEYKIPASFGHDVARCKECSGVVNIGPVQSADAPAAPAQEASKAEAPKAQPMPAKKVAPRPAPAPKPKAPAKPVEHERVKAESAEQKRKERGTLAKLKAARAAATQAEAKPAAKPRAVKPAARRSPAKAETGGARRSSRPGGGSRRSGGRSSGRSGGRGGDKEKKGAPIGLIAGVAVLLIAAVVFMFKDSLFGSEDAPEVVAKETTEVTPDEPTEAPVDDPAPVEDEAPVEEEEKKPEKPKSKPRDPASIDLTGLPKLKKARGTTDEEWAEMEELMTTWMDLGAGAAGPRSGRQLAEYGRKAMPVILNHWQTFDLENNPEHLRLGDMIQKQVQSICNGRNYGWKYEGSENRIWFNKQVIVNWNTLWLQVEEDIIAWINLAKLDTKDPKAARKLLAEYGEAAEDDFSGADDLDDLGVD